MSSSDAAGVPVADLDERSLLARATAAARLRWPAASVVGLHPLPGGVSSLTFASAVRRPAEAEEPVVLKVAPPGLAPVGNRDVLRQAMVLRLLAATPRIRVPAVLFDGPGPPPFFGMQLIAGESYEPGLDVSSSPPSADVVNLRARAAARMLAELHALDPVGLGLAEEPVLPVRGELDRWSRLLATVEDDLCPGHAELHERLSRRVPAASESTLLHGDYRLANMLFVDDRLGAVIDWEIWSVGDPRTDLAWLLMHTDPVHRFFDQRGTENDKAGLGMPQLGDLLAEYLRVRPADVDQLDWFLAYCHYKTAATIAVIAKRNRRQSRPDGKIVTAAESLPAVIARAHEILTSAESGRPWRR